MHPLGSIQSYENEIWESAYIQPSTEAVAISTHNIFFFKLNKNELTEHYTKRHYAYICAAFKPMEYTVITRECDILAMTRPETMTLVDCNIAIDTTGQTDWTYLATSKTWVFSTPKEEKLKEICPNLLEQTVKIIRTGQLVLNDNCVLKAHSFIIKGSTKNLEKDKILLPDFTLNVTNLIHDKYSAVVTDQILLSITGKKLGTQSRCYVTQIRSGPQETNETVNQNLIFKWIVVTNLILTILLGGGFRSAGTQNEKGNKAIQPNPQTWDASIPPYLEYDMCNRRVSGQFFNFS